MSDSAHPIRSYQRIFKPDRRIYQIDGRRLPVPGGVPLEWLGWAFGALIVVLVLSQRSIIARAASSRRSAALLGASSHGWAGAVIGALAGFVLTLLAGVVLGWLDWPLRLLIAPGMIATLAGQSSPDGRPAHRYLTSLVSAADARGSPLARWRDPRRGRGARVGAAGVGRPGRALAGASPRPRARPGAARVRAPVVVIPGRGRLIVRRAEGHRMRSGERLCEVDRARRRAGRGGPAMSASRLRYAHGNVLIGRGEDSAAPVPAGDDVLPVPADRRKWALQRRLQRLAHTSPRTSRCGGSTVPTPPTSTSQHTAGLLDERHQDPEAWRQFLRGHEHGCASSGHTFPRSTSRSRSPERTDRGRLRARTQRRSCAPPGRGAGRHRRRAPRSPAASSQNSPRASSACSSASTASSTPAAHAPLELQWLLRRAVCRGVCRARRSM